MKTDGKAFSETDLYEPLKLWFEASGCRTQGEVAEVDLVAVFSNELVIAVELKKTLNLEVICQAVERQSRADIVFIAIPDLKGLKRNKRLKQSLLLLKRLNIGLLSVNMLGAIRGVRCVMLPDYPSDSKRYISPNHKKKQKLLQEFNNRQLNINIGGSSKTKLMTLYRERAYEIGLQMLDAETVAPKSITVSGMTRTQVNALLKDNHYGWFVHASRGKYALSREGEAAVREFKKAHNQASEAMNPKLELKEESNGTIATDTDDAS